MTNDPINREIRRMFDEGRATKVILVLQDFLRVKLLENGLVADFRLFQPAIRAAEGSDLFVMIEGIPVYVDDFEWDGIDIRGVLTQRMFELYGEPSAAVIAEMEAGMSVCVPKGELTMLRRVRDLVAEALRQKGDDVCWRDIYNPEIAALVGVTDFDPELLPEEQFVDRNCRHFHQCLAAGMPYETPKDEA